MRIPVLLVGCLGVLLLAGRGNAQQASEISDAERLAQECTYVTTAQRPDGELEGQFSAGFGAFRGLTGVGGDIGGSVSRQITHETIHMRNGMGDPTGSLQRTLDVQRMQGVCMEYSTTEKQVDSDLPQVLPSR
jgi:hypothetical protein